MSDQHRRGLCTGALRHAGRLVLVYCIHCKNCATNVRNNYSSTVYTVQCTTVIIAFTTSTYLSARVHYVETNEKSTLSFNFPNLMHTSTTNIIKFIEPVFSTNVERVNRITAQFNIFFIRVI